MKKRINLDKTAIYNWDIYMITNPEGGVYIGCSRQFKIRITYYKNLHCKNQTLLYNSLIKYGYDSHEIKVLDSFESDYKYAEGKEIFWIRSYMSNINQWPDMNGMNQTRGSLGCLGKPVKEETTKKRLETIRKNPVIFSEERRRKVGLSKIGNTYMRGKKMSEESKRKMFESRKTCKAVLQFDKEGNFIKEYPAKRIASKETGISRNALNNALNGGKSKLPYVFKYKQ